MTIGEWRRGLRTLIQLELSRTSMEVEEGGWQGLAGYLRLAGVGCGWLELVGWILLELTRAGSPCTGLRVFSFVSVSLELPQNVSFFASQDILPAHHPHTGT